MENKKLKLNKETIASLKDESLAGVKGGLINNNQANNNNLNFWTCNGNCSAGCSDGCFVTRTWFNCTKTACSNDCPASKKNDCPSCNRPKSVCA